MIQYACAALGFVTGFAVGIVALAHITRGERMKELLGDSEKKFWLGLFGWFFAATGAWAGWQLSGLLLGN